MPNPNGWRRTEQTLELGYYQLRGPVTWTYYYLYVILDVYSRYVVGGDRRTRIRRTRPGTHSREPVAKQEIQPGQLTLHADNGSAYDRQECRAVVDRPGGGQVAFAPHVIR